MNLIAELVYWHWILLGVILIILEVFSPGAYLLWLGLAAGATGLIALFVPDLPWQAQSLIFAMLSLGTVLGARQWLLKHPIKTDQPTLNRRGEHYVGREFTLQAPIEHGQGKIQVDDTRWKIHGEDSPAGSRVQVIGVDGVVLQVKVISKKAYTK